MSKNMGIVVIQCYNNNHFDQNESTFHVFLFNLATGDILSKLDSTLEGVLLLPGQCSCETGEGQRPRKVTAWNAHVSVENRHWNQGRREGEEEYLGQRLAGNTLPHALLEGLLGEATWRAEKGEREAEGLKETLRQLEREAGEKVSETESLKC